MADFWTRAATCVNTFELYAVIESASEHRIVLNRALLPRKLTPWSRVLLEKLTSSQLVKKFPAFYGTRRFVTAFTSARHLSLSWARSVQSMPPHPISWRSILILSSHLRLGLLSGLFPSDFHQNSACTSAFLNWKHVRQMLAYPGFAIGFIQTHLY